LSGGVGAILGVDQRGELNALVTSTKTIFAETPATVTLTAISAGTNGEGEGRATLWLLNGTGWEIDLHLFVEPSGGHNVRLFGSAIPLTINECGGAFGNPECPGVNPT
jgi:hypothetical protein